MLSKYLNQNVTYKIITSTNAYNEKTYSTSTIKARFIYKREVIRNADNEQIMSDAIIYTKTAIEEGNIIVNDGKDWVIRFVYPWVGLDGNVIGYKGVL